MANANGFANITADGTTTYGSPSSGLRLRCVTCNTAGTTSVLTLYAGQSASAPVIGTFDMNSLRTIFFEGLRCTNGLTAVLSSGTAANITLIWD